MRIIIKLTNKEFDAIERVINLKSQVDTVAIDTLREMLLISWTGERYRVTILGQLAWEQNKPKEKVEKAKDVRYTRAVDYWLKEFHVDWTFGAIQGKALKGLLRKIQATCVARGLSGDEENVYQSFKAFCQKLPDWFKDKDLPVLDSKYNEIVTQIQHGKEQQGYYSKNSADRFSDFAAR